jgi:ubiquinone/menaquinone biosynthesis C-methylase UbiE
MGQVPSRSAEAYDLPSRVARYDADMEIMHPLRAKMADIAVEALPFARDGAVSVIDLGAGTGYFTQRVLAEFPHAEAIAIDGAAAMVELAKARLAGAAERVRWVVSDFRELGRNVAPEGSVDVILSAFALHHLSAEEKLAVLQELAPCLKPDGWFVNADLIVAERPVVEERIQQLRVEGIVRRAPAGDDRFAEASVVRAHLDALEANEGDRPLTLLEDLRIIRAAGFGGAEVLWKEYREAVIGGPR